MKRRKRKPETHLLKDSLVHRDTIRRESRANPIRGSRKDDFSILVPPNQAMWDFRRTIGREKRNRFWGFLPYPKMLVRSIAVPA